MSAGARVYLDWNATAPLRPESRAAMQAAMDVAGNPSSVHSEGRAARALVERSRAAVAAAAGCRPDEVIFTSGATEAAAVLARLAPVIVDATAHDALWAHADAEGLGARPATLAMGLANSETGIVTPPPARGEGGWPAGPHCAGRLLLDVTQALGRLPWSFAWSGADMAVLSAHKLGGPKGIGALILRDGAGVAPLLAGGGQESGRRSGTENVIGIAGFAAAATAAAAELAAGVWEGVARLRDRLEAVLADGAPDTIFIGAGSPRLPNTSCLAAPGWRGETQVMAMDLGGFAVSAGSACSSGKVRPSRVLAAMGHDDDVARSAIRVSLGPRITEDEIMRFAGHWLDENAKFRRRRRLGAA